MNAYKDRGIIKWSPFDGLAGFVDMMEELRYKLGKKPKPMLSDDVLADMDYVLKEALQSGKSIAVNYYHDGYVKTEFGCITKLNLIDRIISINHRKYLMDDIVNLIFID